MMDIQHRALQKNVAHPVHGTSARGHAFFNACDSFLPSASGWQHLATPLSRPLCELCSTNCTPPAPTEQNATDRRVLNRWYPDLCLSRTVLTVHTHTHTHTHTQTHTHGGWGIMTLRIVNGTKCLDKCMVFVAMQPSMFGLLPGHDGVLCRPGSRVRPGITKLMQPGSCFPRAVRWLPNDFPRGPQ